VLDLGRTAFTLNILNAWRDTMLETTNELSIGTMTINFGWPWNVLVQAHQNCTSTI